VSKIESYLAGSSDLSVSSYTITGASGGSRQLSHCTHDQLISLLKYWRSRLTAEERAAAGAHLQSIRYAL
jgi:hypothetical protein